MFEGLFQPMHLLVIVGIALLVFGPKKLPELGKGIGEGIRGFKAAINNEEKPASTTTTRNCHEVRTSFDKQVTRPTDRHVLALNQTPHMHRRQSSRIRRLVFGQGAIRNTASWSD